MQSIEEQLVEIDENLNMENLHANQEKVKEIEPLLEPSLFGSYFLELIKARFGDFGLKQEYFNMILSAFKTFILGEDPVGKIKLGI